jgi:cytochrome c peroxidase
MRKISPYKLTALFATIFVIVWGCKKLDLTIPNTNTPTDPFAATKLAFGTNINFDSLSNYANQTKPTYITLDNTGTNSITNAKATLGRVLFYDKNQNGYRAGCSCIGCPANENGVCITVHTHIDEVCFHHYDGDNCVKVLCG